MDVQPNIQDLQQVLHNIKNPTKRVKVGIVGHTDLIESYKSLDEALNHGAPNQLEFEPVYIDVEDLETDKKEAILQSVDGILVPGGFGERGTEERLRRLNMRGKIIFHFLEFVLACNRHDQYSRNVVWNSDATSEEFEQTGTPIIHYLKGQSKDVSKEAHEVGSL